MRMRGCVFHSMPEDGIVADVLRTQKHYPGDSWSEPGNNLYGCLKQVS